MLFRKGCKNEYFIDKINPFAHTPLTIQNFTDDDNFLKRFRNLAIKDVKEEESSDSECEEIIKGTRFFESEIGLKQKIDHNFVLEDLQKRRFSEFEKEIQCGKRLINNFSFSENDFVKKFLKKKKNK